MAKGNGVGQGLGQKDRTTVKGQWGGVRTSVKGGQGLGSGGNSDMRGEIHVCSTSPVGSREAQKLI